MKTQIKRMSKRSLAVVLSILMIVSALVVGYIPTAYAALTTVKIAGSFNSWSAKTLTFSNNTATYQVNAGKGVTISFKYLLSDNGGNTDIWNGVSDSSISSDTEYELQWNGGNDIKYTTKSNGSGIVNITFRADSSKSKNYVKVTETAAETNYYVSGGKQPIGTTVDRTKDWVANEASQKMTKSGTNYIKTYSSVPAGTYEFQITDGSWDHVYKHGNCTTQYTGDAVNAESSGNENVRFTLSSTATTVTITFTPTSKIVVNAVAAAKNAYVFGALATSGDTWTSTLHTMTYDSGQGEYYYDVTPTANKIYYYRLRYDTTYYKPTDNSNDVSALSNTGVSTVTASNDGDGKAFYFGATKDSTYRIHLKHSTTGTVTTWVTLVSSGGGDDDKIETVDIYLKNGSLRTHEYYENADHYFNRFTDLANTDIVSIKVPDGINWSSTKWHKDYSEFESTYDYVKDVPVGSTITFKTTLTGTASNSLAFSKKAFKETHYVRGYSINGTTYEVYTPREDGVYTMTWTVESVNTETTLDGKSIEITPVYYLKDTSNVKTFYIDGYTDDLRQTGGNTLYVYPYYNNTEDRLNAFGGYPGQPMLNWGGKFQVQIPLTSDGTSTGHEIKGLTIHNGYLDALHQRLDTKCKDHRQTYDYDNFQKIYKEKLNYNNKKLDSIYFWFKYRITHDNFNDGDSNKENLDPAKDYQEIPISNVDKYNTPEVITDHYDRQVDLLGNQITSANLSTYDPKKDVNGSTLKGNELLIVSTGYKKTYVGENSTLWAIYTQPTRGNFKFLGYITPSLLTLNSISDVNKYENGTSIAQGQMSWPTFINTYNAITKTYKGKPAIMSYEREIKSGDVLRSDGRWYYTMEGDSVDANVKIQYADTTTKPDIDSSDWKDDTFDTTTPGYNNKYNIGSHTKCSAYFTNEEPKNLVGMTEAKDITTGNDDYFTFQAKSAGDWIFAGWVRESGGELYDVTSTNGLGKSSITSDDTYIARFIKAQTGTLVISHNIGHDDKSYKGTGTSDLKVEILNDTNSQPVKTYNVTDGSDVNISQYMHTKYASYTIRVTLTTTPDTDCAIAKRTCNSTNSLFSTSSTANTVTKTFTVQQVLQSNVTSLRYITYLTRTEYTYNYEIKYNYVSRFFGNQSYTFTGTVEDSIGVFTGSKSSATLTDSFIKSSTPFEKNFSETIKWNYTTNKVGDANAMTKSCTGSGTTYTLKAEVYASSEKNTNDLRAEFVLPYKYNADTVNDGERIYGNKKPVALPVYDGDEKTAESEIAFDENSYESFTLRSSFGGLFQYDNSTGVGSEDKTTDDYKLVEAAPYVLKDVKFHYDSQKRVDGIEKGEYNKKYFTRWDIYSSNGKYITSSFYPHFNYCAYESYKIIPIYEKDNPGDLPTVYTGDGSDPSVKSPAVNRNEDISASVSYLGATRNQWNNGGSGTYQSTTGMIDATTVGDKIFADFALAFNYKGENINKIPTSEADIKYGMIIEKLKKLDDDSGEKITDASYYAEEFNQDGKYSLSSITDYVKNKVNGNSATRPTGSSGALFCSIGDNNSSHALSNMNRLQYFYTFTSANNNGDVDDDEYVYRASSYIYVDSKDGTEAKISVSAPVYFTFYETAKS